MLDKVCTLVRGDTRKIGKNVAQSLIDRSNIFAKFASHRKRHGALIIRTIYLLPCRSDEYLRIIAVELGRILTRRKVKAE